MSPECIAFTPLFHNYIEHTFDKQYIMRINVRKLLEKNDAYVL
jgi:hypothetical protein